MIINNDKETKIKTEAGLTLSNSYLFGSKKESIEIAAKTLTLKDSFFQAKKIVIASDEINCLSSSLNADHIYITNNANFGDCQLNGEIHKNSLEVTENML